MSQLGLIILVALIIGIVYLILLRNYDIYDTEPFGIMLISFVVGGIVSIGVTTFLYAFVSVEHTFFQAFYKVGLIEELAKLITFFLIYRVIRRHFDEIVDGIIYMSCIALGFAVIENVEYALSSESPFTLLAIRAFTSTIGHMAFSGIMGIALFVHFRVHNNGLGIGLSLLIAAFAHGFYDGVLFKSELNWSFGFVYSLIVMTAFWVIRITLSFSRFRKPFEFSLFKKSSITENELCVNCGTRSKDAKFEFWKIKYQQCESCRHLVFNFKSWKQVTRYYLPLRYWKSEVKMFRKSTNIPFRFGENAEHILDVNMELVSCNSQTLSTWLISENKKDKSKYLNKPVIGWFLKGIGLRYLTVDS